MNDLNFAFRQLLKNPGFSTIAVLTLALGIGMNASIFNLAQALLVRSVPGLREPGRLVQIGATRNGEGFHTLSYADFAEFRAQSRTVELAASYDSHFHLGSGVTAERVRGAVVSWNYFELLGVGVAAGRTFLQEEDTAPGKDPVAVISFGLWQRWFGSDKDIVGRTMILNGFPFTIVGVTAAEFKGTERLRELEVWVPMAMLAKAAPEFAATPDIFSNHDVVWHDAVGRLKPGVSRTRAQVELRVIAKRLAQSFPASNDDRGVAIASGTSINQRDASQTRQGVMFLLAVTGLVLLGTYANVTNMQLARGVARRREMGIRMALGARGGRLVRQLFTENLLLALLAGGCGIMLAEWFSKLLVWFAPTSMELSTLQLSFDPMVFAFAAALMLLTGIACGLAPSWSLAGRDVIGALKNTSAQSGSSKTLLGNGLVVAQVAFSLVLLLGAGLFLRTLQTVLHQKTGLPVNSILVASVDVGVRGYSEEQGLRFFAALRKRVLELPGVQAASVATIRPFNDTGAASPARPESAEAGSEMLLRSTTVSPGFFETLTIPVHEGRDFNAADKLGAPAVAIVDESTAKRFWPGVSPLGKRLVVGGKSEAQSFVIVGVVRDTRFALDQRLAEPMMYLPYAQHYQPQSVLHVRAKGSPAGLAVDVRAAAAALDPNLPPFAIRTIAEEISRSLGPQRITAKLMSVFATLALALSAVGIYGLIGWTVAQRTREFGVRMALGAQPIDVLLLILRQGGRLILLGFAIGLALSFMLTCLVKNQLLGISTSDPATYAAVLGILGTVGLVASYLPARRAARIDPMEALRYE